MPADKKSLESEIKGSILIPGDEGYEESLKRWAGNFEKKAGYVVFVECAEDISKTVLFPATCFPDNRSCGLLKISLTLLSNVEDIPVPGRLLLKVESLVASKIYVANSQWTCRI